MFYNGLEYTTFLLHLQLLFFVLLAQIHLEWDVHNHDNILQVAVEVMDNLDLWEVDFQKYFHHSYEDRSRQNYLLLFSSVYLLSLVFCGLFIQQQIRSLP